MGEQGDMRMGFRGGASGVVRSHLQQVPRRQGGKRQDQQCLNVVQYELIASVTYAFNVPLYLGD